MSLAHKAARGGLAITAGQLLKILLQFINILILSRLLEPSEFGLVAMVLSIFGVGEVIRDFGLSSAVVQSKTLSKEQLSNLFWSSLFLGVVLTLIAYTSANLISIFFEYPELKTIGEVMSVMFIINSISSQYRAQLNRSLKFGVMAITDVTSVIIGISAGIFSAINGKGYWAIVVQQLTQYLVQMTLYIFFTKWIPSAPSIKTDMRRFYSFGLNLMLAQILGYLSKSIPSILIGNRLGSEPLGFYDRASQILMLPLNQINAPSSTIAIPTLSKLQDNNNKYNSFLLYGQNVIVNLVLLFLALIFCQTENLVLLVLGDKWLPSATIFRGLSGAGCFLILSYASYWVYVSKGLTHKLLKHNLISRPIIIVVTFTGLTWGVEGVAIGYSIGLMINWLLALFWIRDSGIPVWRMIKGPFSLTLFYFSISMLSMFITSSFLLRTPVLSIFVSWSLILLFMFFSYYLLPFYNRNITDIFRIKEYIKV